MEMLLTHNFFWCVVQLILLRIMGSSTRGVLGKVGIQRLCKAKYDVTYILIFSGKFVGELSSSPLSSSSGFFLAEQFWGCGKITVTGASSGFVRTTPVTTQKSHMEEKI